MPKTTTFKQSKARKIAIAKALGYKYDAEAAKENTKKRRKYKSILLRLEKEKKEIESSPKGLARTYTLQRVNEKIATTKKNIANRREKHNIFKNAK